MAARGNAAKLKVDMQKVPDVDADVDLEATIEFLNSSSGSWSSMAIQILWFAIRIGSLCHFH